MSTEIIQIPRFIEVLSEHYPDLGFRLVMVGHHKTKGWLFFKKHDIYDNVYIFYCNSSNEEYQEIIRYIHEHGFPEDGADYFPIYQKEESDEMSIDEAKASIAEYIEKDENLWFNHFQENHGEMRKD